MKKILTRLKVDSGTISGTFRLRQRLVVNATRLIATAGLEYIRMTDNDTPDGRTLKMNKPRSAFQRLNNEHLKSSTMTIFCCCHSMMSLMGITQIESCVCFFFDIFCYFPAIQYRFNLKRLIIESITLVSGKLI